MEYEIELDQKVCMGCGACAAASPNYFKMNFQGKSELISSNTKNNIQILKLKQDHKTNLEAIEYCPIKCIKIKIIKEN